MVARATFEGHEGRPARARGRRRSPRRSSTTPARSPPGVYLSLAVGSIGLSALLHLAGRKNDSQFVGHWVPTILLLGLYNKLVKLQGSD